MLSTKTIQLHIALLQDKFRSRLEKRHLSDAGLGEKIITVNKSGDTSEFREKLEDHFPPLRAEGGFELLPVSVKNRSLLELIPTRKYAAEHLAELMGQAKIFIRPLQRALECSDTNKEVNKT